jgi:beta-lactamase regulating signal transducer with metallopeptidase domain
MRPLASAVVLGLAWFAAINALATLAAVAIGARLSDRTAACPRRARTLLLVRFFPVGAASVLAALLFAPAHLWLEPPNANERAGLVILSLVFVALVLFARAFCNLARIVNGAALLRRYAERAARCDAASALTDVPNGVGIALAGVLRPRVLIGSSTRRVLSPEELEVAVAHELAHQRARDNVARALMLCVPDLLGWTGAGRRLERLWAAEAECLADARAINGDPARATCLASALLKVARIAADPQAERSAAWSTFHHHRLLLETRVRLLVDEAPARVPHNHSVSMFAAAFVMAVAALWLIGVPSSLHHLTETLIAALP